MIATLEHQSSITAQETHELLYYLVCVLSLKSNMTGVMRKGPLSFDVTILRKRRQSQNRGT